MKEVKGGGSHSAIEKIKTGNMTVQRKIPISG